KAAPVLADGNRAVLIMLYGPVLLGAALFGLPAWLMVRWITRRYAAGRVSDQTISFDSLWLLSTVFLCSDLIIDRGQVGWIGLMAFAGYKLTTVLGLRPLRRAAMGRAVPQLLL